MKNFALNSLNKLLATNGMRATQQRLLLARLLFGSASRHVDAQLLHAEAKSAHKGISLATVYNTLNEFEQAGLLRRVAVPSERVWFDTDTGEHKHFYVESENKVFDLENDHEIVAPPGYQITHIDTVVHLKKIEPDSRTETKR